MFSCVGRGDHWRFSSGQKKQSFTPDPYVNYSEANNNTNHRNRVPSKTPPPQYGNSVLAPMTDNRASIYLYDQQMPMTPSKSHIKAVQATARRVLCGSSPQPASLTTNQAIV